jgi:hypothetical protein
MIENPEPFWYYLTIVQKLIFQDLNPFAGCLEKGEIGMDK